MSPKEHLIAAKALIGSPDRWTKQSFAREEDGSPIPARSDQAVCWCSVGALGVITGISYLNAKMALKDALPVGFKLVTDYNDYVNTKHQDIMDLFDRAIEAQP